MGDYDQFKEEFDMCFKTLQKMTEGSFSLMESCPERKNEIINLWKGNILEFISNTYRTGEKYNNKEIFKTITKALMFGR